MDSEQRPSDERLVEERLRVLADDSHWNPLTLRPRAWTGEVGSRAHRRSFVVRSAIGVVVVVALVAAVFVGLGLGPWRPTPGPASMARNGSTQPVSCPTAPGKVVPSTVNGAKDSIVPAAYGSMTICVYDPGDELVHRAVIADPTVIAQMSNLLDRSTTRAPKSCSYERGVMADIFFSGGAPQLEVSATAFGCGEASNGLRTVWGIDAGQLNALIYLPSTPATATKPSSFSTTVCPSTPTAPVESHVAGARDVLLPFTPTVGLLCLYEPLQQHGLVRSARVTDAATLQQLRDQYDGSAEAAPSGTLSCPMDDGSSAVGYFQTGAEQIAVQFELTGCGAAGNGTLKGVLLRGPQAGDLEQHVRALLAGGVKPPTMAVPAAQASDLARIVVGSTGTRSFFTMPPGLKGWEVRGGCLTTAGRGSTVALGYALHAQPGGQIIESGTFGCDGSPQLNESAAPTTRSQQLELVITGDLAAVTQAYLVLRPLP